MANGMRISDSCGFNKGCSLRFRVGSRIRQTPEDGRRIYRPKRCGNNNNNEDSIPKTLNDKNHLLESGKRYIGTISGSLARKYIVTISWGLTRRSIGTISWSLVRRYISKISWSLTETCIGTISIYNRPRLYTPNIDRFNQRKWFHTERNIQQKLLLCRWSRATCKYTCSSKMSSTKTWAGRKKYWSQLELRIQVF